MTARIFFSFGCDDEDYGTEGKDRNKRNACSKRHEFGVMFEITKIIFDSDMRWSACAGLFYYLYAVLPEIA